MVAETRVPEGLDRSEVERYIAHRPPVEMLMARSIVRRGVVVGPLIVLAAGLLRGLDGATAALIGVAIVGGLLPSDRFDDVVLGEGVARGPIMRVPSWGS